MQERRGHWGYIVIMLMAVAMMMNAGCGCHQKVGSEKNINEMCSTALIGQLAIQLKPLWRGSPVWFRLQICTAPCFLKLRMSNGDFSLRFELSHRNPMQAAPLACGKPAGKVCPFASPSLWYCSGKLTIPTATSQ